LLPIWLISLVILRHASSISSSPVRNTNTSPGDVLQEPEMGALAVEWCAMLHAPLAAQQMRSRDASYSAVHVGAVTVFHMHAEAAGVH
jgi:hypothetical protein